MQYMSPARQHSQRSRITTERSQPAISRTTVGAKTERLGHILQLDQITYVHRAFVRQGVVGGVQIHDRSGPAEHHRNSPHAHASTSVITLAPVYTVQKLVETLAVRGFSAAGRPQHDLPKVHSHHRVKPPTTKTRASSAGFIFACLQQATGLQRRINSPLMMHCESTRCICLCRALAWQTSLLTDRRLAPLTSVSVLRLPLSREAEWMMTCW